MHFYNVIVAFLTLHTTFLPGPEGTVYEGGQFILSIKFPPDNPFKPPHLKFDTKIYHPNVSDSGEICAGMIKDQWTPAMSILKVMNSLVSMMLEPNAEQAVNMTVAHLFKSDHKLFEATARAETKKFASGN